MECIVNDKPTFAAVALASAVCASFVTATNAGNESPSPPTVQAVRRGVSELVAWQRGLPAEGELPSLDGATAWLNSPPLTAAGLRGKVVLIEFWTYSCINWRRESPFVRAWAAKYRDRGLVVIGVHSPEFEFEKNIDNVRRAAREIGVLHAIAVDGNHTIWRAFGNAYWPALYFVDAHGRIRHHHFGEGDYDESEKVIQQLLLEAGAAGVEPAGGVSAGTGAEAPPDWANLRSGENYVGYVRTENLDSAGAVRDQARSYAAPARLRLNHWALDGDWTLRAQAAASNRPGSRIAYSFHARDLHLVMGPAIPGRPVRFRVSIDGQLPGPAHGADTDAQGRGTVTEPRMFQLIRQSGAINDRRFEIEFLDPGAEVYSFTFG